MSMFAAPRCWIRCRPVAGLLKFYILCCKHQESGCASLENNVKDVYFKRPIYSLICGGTYANHSLLKC